MLLVETIIGYHTTVCIRKFTNGGMCDVKANLNTSNYSCKVSENSMAFQNYLESLSRLS